MRYQSYFATWLRYSAQSTLYWYKRYNFPPSSVWLLCPCLLLFFSLVSENYWLKPLRFDPCQLPDLMSYTSCLGHWPCHTGCLFFPEEAMFLRILHLIFLLFPPFASSSNFMYVPSQMSLLHKATHRMPEIFYKNGNFQRLSRIWKLILDWGGYQNKL